MKRLRVATLAVLLFLGSGFYLNAVADEIHLKNGSIIKGEIIATALGKTYSIRTSDGSLFVFKVEEIADVQFDATRELKKGKQYASKGVLEFGGNIVPFKLMKPDYGSIIQLTLEPLIGYFPTSQFEIGISPIFNLLRISNYGEETGIEYGLLFSPQYIITQSENNFPFIGANIILSGCEDELFFDEDTGIFGIGPLVGLKIPVGGSGLLTVSMNYTFKRFFEEEENIHDVGLNLSFTIFTSR